MIKMGKHLQNLEEYKLETKDTEFGNIVYQKADKIILKLKQNSFLPRR